MFNHKLKNRIRRSEMDCVERLFAFVAGFVVFVLIVDALCPLSETEKETREKHKIECLGPKLMSTTPEGLQLWAHNWCEQYPVYFTTYGAEWNERHLAGKTSRIEHRNTPSGE